MRIDASASDGIATRLRHRHPAAAREKRAGEEDRRANLLRELDVRIGADLALRVDADDVLLETLDARAKPFENLQHHPNVLNVRQVSQDDRLIGEQAGGKDRQSGVLVPARPDRSFQPAATFDYETFGHREGIVYGGAGARG